MITMIVTTINSSNNSINSNPEAVTSSAIATVQCTLAQETIGPCFSLAAPWKGQDHFRRRRQAMTTFADITTTDPCAIIATTNNNIDSNSSTAQGTFNNHSDANQAWNDDHDQPTTVETIAEAPTTTATET
mmetsp:Transcript_9954/g.28253  ORF Transcript_9954/g.28253 Transcript_9954/m.28253 type:complete len:131 (-) Transcript_9954:454-846(-)